MTKYIFRTGIEHIQHDIESQIKRQIFHQSLALLINRAKNVTASVQGIWNKQMYFIAHVTRSVNSLEQEKLDDGNRCQINWLNKILLINSNHSSQLTSSTFFDIHWIISDEWSITSKNMIAARNWSNRRRKSFFKLNWQWENESNKPPHMRISFPHIEACSRKLRNSINEKSITLKEI